ncbi:RHS repeat-associated core domain-containing protein [Orenia marismortui]|uniref:RHS repeat-associated core domain-containing protein n=1 Tax=Orenia marismortui TaxID=46469 RepID=UPI00038073F9|nr:RHS repeat-associated core domain-containing protein [Orenia marismortui]
MENLYAVGSGIDEVLGVYGEQSQYLHSNHLGSITGITGIDGIVLGARSYTPYGMVRNTTGSFNSDLGFIGRSQGGITGLTYIRARYYDASMGRFTRVDPIKDGLNWYGYCGGNPVNFYDPTGLVRWGQLALGSLQAVGGGFEFAAGFGSEFGSGGLSTPVSILAMADGASNVSEGFANIWDSFSDSDVNTDKYNPIKYGMKEAGEYVGGKYGRYKWGSECGENAGRKIGRDLGGLGYTIFNTGLNAAATIDGVRNFSDDLLRKSPTRTIENIGSSLFNANKSAQSGWMAVEQSYHKVRLGGHIAGFVNDSYGYGSLGYHAYKGY